MNRTRKILATTIVVLGVLVILSISVTAAEDNHFLGFFDNDDQLAKSQTSAMTVALGNKLTTLLQDIFLPVVLNSYTTKYP